MILSVKLLERLKRGIELFLSRRLPGSHEGRPVVVELRDLGADGAHLEDLRLGIFLVLLHDTDLLRDRVALALERLRLLQEIAALLVEAFKIIEVQRVAAVLEHLTDFVEMFAHKFDIQQCSHTPL